MIGTKIEVEMGGEEREKYNRLVGHTPFCFFKDFNSKVIIFDYYEKYAFDLVKGLCNAQGRNCELEFTYLLNPEINAGCRLEGQKNQLYILEGTLYKIYDCASLLSCIYETIAMKNQKSGGKVSTIEMQVYSGNKGALIMSDIRISESIEANVITDYIAMIATKMVIAHEVGHILNGHLAYRKENGERTIAFSMSNTCTSIGKSTELQAMEIDADEFAACQIISILEGELLTDAKLREIVQDETQIYRMVGCAIQCVFFLIGVKNDFWEIDEPERYSHPPALTRLNLFLETCRGLLNDDGKWSHIVQGVIIAHKNFCDQYGVRFIHREQFVLDIMGKNEYGEIVVNHWRKLKQNLMPFSILPFV